MTMSKLANLSSVNWCYVPKLALNYPCVSTVIWRSLDGWVKLKMASYGCYIQPYDFLCSIFVLYFRRIIWFGDLNYRIDLSYERAHELISKQDWDGLFERDQVI
jgi:hypothetical protein